MTFSLLARCDDAGELGIAVTTSDLAVGARVPSAIPGVGVAVTQHRTDPRLGPQALMLVRAGRPPREAVATVTQATPHRWWRQLAVMNASGETAAFSGEGVTPICAVEAGPGCLVVANMLANEDVAPAIVRAFADSAGHPLAARLIGGLEAGEAAGGEARALGSAAVLVTGTEEFPRVDLRVDSADTPLVALRSLWEEYEPWIGDFIRRALDPDAATGAPRPDHRPRSTTT